MGSVGGAAGVLGVAGDAGWVGDVGVLASSGDAVGPEVVGGDLVVEGVVFGLVVEHVGFEVEGDAAGGAGDGDVSAFWAGVGGEVFGGGVGRLEVPTPCPSVCTRTGLFMPDMY